MAFSPTAVGLDTALSVFARLYNCGEPDLAAMTAQLTAAWTVREDSHNVWGALGLRPSPAHGAEVMGGAFPGSRQHEAALALLRVAVAAQPHLYAYAEPHLLPAATLEAANLRPAGAYTRMTGPLPEVLPEAPDGYRIVALSEVGEPQDRLLAERTYSDRIGHTQVPFEAAEPNFGGSDDTLGRLAYDASGLPAGLCRVSLNGEVAVLGTPGVRPGARGGELRRALLLSACRAARAAGATHLKLEAWGDTETERAEDEALGLVVEVLTPIHATILPHR